jgi:hypothetical protein
MSIHVSSSIEASARRLFPNLSLDQAVRQMLLERAQKNLIKYQTMRRQYQDKYGMDFEVFRQIILSSDPAQEEEQDYFDWELAVTGIADMQTEIDQLKKSARSS